MADLLIWVNIDRFGENTMVMRPSGLGVRQPGMGSSPCTATRSSHAAFRRWGASIAISMEAYRGPSLFLQGLTWDAAHLVVVASSIGCDGLARSGEGALALRAHPIRMAKDLDCNAPSEVE